MQNGAEAEVAEPDSAQPSGLAEQEIVNGSQGKSRKRRKRRLPKTLSRDEMERLLDAPNLRSASGARDRCILELMYRAGLRVGEVVALQPRDVDTGRGTIRILDGKGGDGTAYFDPASIAPHLERWREKRRALGLARSPYLFCTIRAGHSKLGRDYQAGGPVSTTQVQQMIKRRARKAGVDPSKVTPHVLRHTFATELLDEDFHIREVQEAMRHANIQTTEVYLHVIDTHLRKKITARERGAKPPQRG